MPFPISRTLGAALLVLAAACGRSDAPRTDASGTDPSRDDTGFRGVVITPPRPKPDFTLADATGKPFDFRRETEGKVTLLFFGYTHCPDVCPLHAANVAAVLRQLPFEERDAIRFVMVSTDPKRDTPQRLGEWLGNFDPGFIGLRGTEEEVNRILYGLRMPPIETDPAAKDTLRYLVGHAAQVIAFGRDGLARTEYPFGVRQEDWAHDLPKLARGEVPNVAAPAGAAFPGSAPGAPGTAGGTAVAAPAIRVSTAIVPAPATTSEAALYLVLENAGAEDTLTAVWSGLAQRAEMHATSGGEGMSHMTAVAEVVVRRGETLAFLPGARHVMLLGLSRKPVAGESVPVTLRFKRGGDVVFAASVVPYAEVEAQLR